MQTNAKVKNFLLLLLAFVDCHKKMGGDFVFYDKYVNLCAQKRISPSAAAEEMGFERSNVTRWSKGVEPRRATLERVAVYFGIPVTFFQEEELPIPSYETHDPLKREEIPPAEKSTQEDELEEKLLGYISRMSEQEKRVLLASFESLLLREQEPHASALRSFV